MGILHVPLHLHLHLHIHVGWHAPLELLVGHGAVTEVVDEGLEGVGGREVWVILGELEEVLHLGKCFCKLIIGGES